MITIDLNCDLGEGFGVYDFVKDEEIMPLITSANIACGFHASNPLLMQKTVRLAKKYNVAVGAHPSYPDLVGFGRREMNIRPEQLKADILYQIGALTAFCRAESVPLTHVKVHGALYNRGVCDLDTACAIADAVASFSSDLYLICPAASAMAEAAGDRPVKVITEGFADRAYDADGNLAARSRDGAVLTDPARIAERAVRMAREQVVKCVDGTDRSLPCRSICVHSDTPGVTTILKDIRTALQREGISVCAVSRG